MLRLKTDDERTNDFRLSRCRGENRREPGWFALIQTILEETTVLQIVLNHHIRDGIENKLNVTGIGGTCEVRVDFFLIATLVQTFEFHLDIRSTFFIRVCTCV